MQVQFGEFELDEEGYLLWKQGVRLRVRPKVFDLLVHLVRCRDRVVLRDELVKSLWGGMAVGPGSLSGLVNELRRILGDDGRSPSSIRTVHARGYQFVAEVEQSAAASRRGRAGPTVEHCVPDEPPGRAGLGSDAIELGTLADPLRGALEEVPSQGARALLVRGHGRVVHAMLLGRAAHVIRRAGFAVESFSCDLPAQDVTRGLVDRLFLGLVASHGAEQIRSMLPVHARYAIERSARRGAVRLARERDPLAARQHEEAIWRGLSDVFRELARARPIALVVEDVDLAGQKEMAAIAALLRHLADCRVLFVCGLDRLGRVGPEDVFADVRSRVDLVEAVLPERSESESLVEEERGSGLPAVLADALLAHARENDDVDLDALVDWLRIERGRTRDAARDRAAPRALALAQHNRHMLSVPFDTMQRRSRVDGG